MRALLHLIATIVLIPYLLLAAAFLLLGTAIATGTLAGFLAALLAFALWLMPWGALGMIAALLCLMALGAAERTRRFGALLLLVLAAACLGVIGFADSRFDAGAALFLAPCAAVALISAWLALSERHAAAALRR